MVKTPRRCRCGEAGSGFDAAEALGTRADEAGEADWEMALNLTVVDRDGAARELQARSGDVLMPLLRDEVDVAIGICGGVISCGTCLVILDEGWSGHVAPPSEDETDMLDALDAPAGARLACQLTLSEAMSGLGLTVAPEA